MLIKHTFHKIFLKNACFRAFIIICFYNIINMYYILVTYLLPSFIGYTLYILFPPRHIKSELFHFGILKAPTSYYPIYWFLQIINNWFLLYFGLFLFNFIDRFLCMQDGKDEAWIFPHHKDKNFNSLLRHLVDEIKSLKYLPNHQSVMCINNLNLKSISILTLCSYVSWFFPSFFCSVNGC